MEIILFLIEVGGFCLFVPGDLFWHFLVESKDAMLALGGVGALLSPFAAIGIGIYTARKQAASALKVSKQQILATTVSASRQRWVDRVRKETAFVIRDLESMMIANPARGDVRLKHWEDALKRSAIIGLLLNPARDDHRRLIDAISEATGAVIDALSNPDKEKLERGNEALETISKAARQIFSAEWQRIKRGEDDSPL